MKTPPSKVALVCFLIQAFCQQVQAAPLVAQTTTNTTTTSASVKTADPMTTLKKTGDNLDNSMKAVSKNIHQKIDEGSKTQTARDLQKAGNNLDKSMKTFGSNVGKRVDAAGKEINQSVKKARTK